VRRESHEDAILVQDWISIPLSREQPSKKIARRNVRSEVIEWRGNIQWCAVREDFGAQDERGVSFRMKKHFLERKIELRTRAILELA
jgi:hypothetical protein